MLYCVLPFPSHQSVVLVAEETSGIIPILHDVCISGGLGVYCESVGLGLGIDFIFAWMNVVVRFHRRLITIITKHSLISLISNTVYWLFVSFCFGELCQPLTMRPVSRDVCGGKTAVSQTVLSLFRHTRSDYLTDRGLWTWVAGLGKLYFRVRTPNQQDNSQT